MKTKFLSTLLLTFIISNIYAQDYSWEKLETEPYRGKQDDITFVNKNTGWYVNGYGQNFSH